MSPSERFSRVIRLVAFPAFVAAVVGLAIAFRGPLMAVAKSPQDVRAWVESAGAAAPLAFMALQAVQVVIFVVPGEIVQVAGGYAFGLWLGTLWSVLGILAGSLVNFGVGRLLGRPFIETLVGSEKAARIEAATGGGKAAAGFLLLFAIPGIPKDALTYAAGAGTMGFGTFIAVSSIGRLPGILGSSYMGSSAFDESYGVALVVLGVAVVLFLVGLVFRERILGFVAGLVARRKAHKGEAEAANRPD